MKLRCSKQKVFEGCQNTAWGYGEANSLCLKIFKVIFNNLDRLIIGILAVVLPFFNHIGRMLSFPPVVFVMLWSSLSQQSLKGSLNSGVNVKPNRGKIAILVRVPTWYARFKMTAMHGILREGIFYILTCPVPV